MKLTRNFSSQNFLPQDTSAVPVSIQAKKCNDYHKTDKYIDDCFPFRGEFHKMKPRKVKKS